MRHSSPPSRTRVPKVARRRAYGWGWPAALGLALLGLYGLTIPTGLPGGDSGELAVAAWRFSVAHPPGYPLYVLLGGAFAHLLAVETVAWRLGMFSALCGAGAAALLARAVGQWTGRAWAGLLAGGLFGLSSQVWIWSTRAEVFALNHLIAAGLSLLAVRFFQMPKRGELWAAAALLGLGLGNHQTILLLGVPLLGAMGWEARRAQLLTGRVGLIALGLFLAALGVNLQLVFGAWWAPEVAWGDTRNLGGLARHLLRLDYGALQLRAGEARWEDGLSGASALLGHQGGALLWVGVPLALLGLWSLLFRQGPRGRALGAAVLIGWLLCGPGFQLLGRFPPEGPLLASVLARFWQLPLLVGCLLAGVGAAALGGARTQIGGWGVPVGTGVLLLVQLARGAGELQAHFRPAPPMATDYGRALLDELPPNALLLTRGDLITNAVSYVKEVEGRRADIVALDQELLTYPWYVARRRSLLSFPGERLHAGTPGSFSLGALLAANPGRPAFLAGELKPGDDSLAGGYRLLPHGLARRLLPAQEASGEGALRRSDQVLEALARTPLADRSVAGVTAADPWAVAVAQEYWEARHRVVFTLLERALAQGDRRALAEVVARYRALIGAHPSAPAAYFKNLGLAYGHLGQEEEMRRAFETYLERAGPQAPDRQAIRQALGRG
ncbi:MAG: DUF2723 domain-containing protein [Myxococcota bacterium]|nr:DUF2723 domain-containing protein [Myxococcota bacterium]